MSAFRKDEFDTGEMRDGHKICRDLCDEGGIEIVHPETCERDDKLGYRATCPWNMVFEAYESVLHAYAEGHDSPALSDLDAVLPRGVEVEVVWRYSGGASWTDYGWEYDAEFSWWFADEADQ